MNIYAKKSTKVMLYYVTNIVFFVEHEKRIQEIL